MMAHHVLRGLLEKITEAEYFASLEMKPEMSVVNSSLLFQ